MGIYCTPISCGDLATCSLSDLGTADAGDITSGTFGLARIPDLPTIKITSGTFNADRIPILPIDRYGSAVLVDGSRSMEGTFSMGTHEIDHLKKVMFRDEHDVALITEGTYLVSLTNKAESVWGNQSLGWLYVYGGVNMYGYPLTEVAAPTQGSHAANKNYVDDHVWGANDITSGTFGLARIPTMDDAHIPNLETLSYGAAFGTAQVPSLGAYKITSGTLNADRIPALPTTRITSGTFNSDRIPVLPTDRYGSAVLVDGSRSMEATLSLGSHPIDEVSKVMFTEDVMIKGTTDYIYLANKADTAWRDLHLGWLDAHAGVYSYGTVNMQGHALIGVVTPTSGSHAANKTWVDSHNWGAGDITEGTFTEARIPNLPTTKITSGTFGTERIPILPTDRYGSAVLVDGSRAMAGTLNMGNHIIDDASKIGFRDIHDVALITEGTYSVSVVNKAESVWGNIECGYSYVHAGFAWYIEDKQAGVNLSAGKLVFLHSDSKWWLTDADTESTTKGLLGIAMAAISANNTGKVSIFGRVYNAGWSWTTGAILYISCTSGGITETTPSGSGDQVRKIGHALSSTTIIFNPDDTILEIT